jgi:exonuclease SbcC
MRPEKLSLKGFGVFRDLIEIDFEGVELFALTGPTGAGKTTILDGICFALYGSVPRHGKGAVAPLVTQGLLEGSAALDFSVGDDRYRVARRVKKDARARGATTSEASLEKGKEVLATGAQQVSQRVIELLGLDFDQFTTCVLLPQGEFARFLHDKPSSRQELLTALLDLGIYDRIATLALNRQRVAEGLLAMIDQRLAEIGSVTAADLDAARQREVDLARLLTWLEEIAPELQTLDREAAELKIEISQQRAMLETITGLAVPTGLEALGEEVARLEAEHRQAGATVSALEGRVADLAAAGATLPAGDDLQRWVDARRSLEATSHQLAEAVHHLEASTAGAGQAAADLAAARESLAAAADADRAAHLRRGLRAGDPCPVCGQELAGPPPPAEASSLAEAEQRVAAAAQEHEHARQALTESTTRVEVLRSRLAAIEGELTGSPGEEELAALQEQVATHRELLAAAGEDLNAGREVLEAAAVRLAAATDRANSLTASLVDTWSKLAQAGVDPPRIDFDQPVPGWLLLGEWKSAAGPRAAAAVEKTSRLLADLDTRRTNVLGSITERLTAAGVSTAGPPRDMVVDALATARNERQRLEDTFAEAAARRGERIKADADQQLARRLTLELRADHFRKWIFDEVFLALVGGANKRLADLTRGQYQLAMAGRDFEVIDNLAAGNRRTVKTLSGGETFLVSLALALSLADQVVAAASGGGPGRLDSLFLDEGFGTLDAEAMDVVATVIAELGASGKTVGIVTHVPELAEQMPVRYELSRGRAGTVLEVVRS